MAVEQNIFFWGGERICPNIQNNIFLNVNSVFSKKVFIFRLARIFSNLPGKLPSGGEEAVAPLLLRLCPYVCCSVMKLLTIFNAVGKL